MCTQLSFKRPSRARCGARYRAHPPPGCVKEPVSRAACGRRRLLRRALPPVLFHLVAGCVPDGVGDRERAVPPGKLPAFVESAGEGGSVEGVEVLEDVGPRVQPGVEHRDAGHAAAELLPEVHEEEAGGRAGGPCLEACEEEMEVRPAGAFAVFGAQGPEHLSEVFPEMAGGAAQEGEPGVVALSFRQALGLEGERAENQIARLIHRACGMTNLKHLFLKMRAQSLKQI